MIQQIICTVKIRRAPTRHDNIHTYIHIYIHRFQTNYNKDVRYPSSHYLSIVTADKGYDSEEGNYILVREQQHAFSVIPARYEHVPVWRAHGKYTKQMKCGYPKLLYNQRNKDETIISVIKRLFGGEQITSRLVRTQNRELSFRCISPTTSTG